MKIKIQAKPFQYERGFDIKLENIRQVYRGKLDNCRCGCGGDYLYTQNEADKMNEGRDKYFIKGSDVAIKNDLKKFESGKFPIKYSYNDTELIFEIHTHDKEYADESEARMGVTLYVNTSQQDISEHSIFKIKDNS